MLKGSFINVLPSLSKNYMKDGQYLVPKLHLNEVTHIASVKGPESAVSLYPIIEPITQENDGWLECAHEPCWLDADAYKRLAAETIVQTLQDKKYFIHIEEDMLPADVFTDAEIVEIMSADPGKLYAWLQHILDFEPDMISAREWISGEIYKFQHPEHLLANPAESD